MLAVIDYGVGNLYSLNSSLEYLGMEAKVTSRREDLAEADKIILPGVGAFGDAAAKLRATGLVDTINEEVGKGKFLLGICLGMQLLFDKSYEYGEHQGLGLIKGYVGSLAEDLAQEGRAMAADPVTAGELCGSDLKVPHMGWNQLDVVREDPIFKYVSSGSHVYYVHSFYAKECVENTLASSIYNIRIPGVVKSGSVYGMQFHPEKSGAVGLGLLKAFGEL